MSDTATAIAWRHMLKEGGRWTASELTVLTGVDRRKTEKLLRNMVDKGYVSSHRSGQRKNGRAYAVAADSRVPQGVLLSEVIEALGTEEPRLEQSTAPRGQYAHVGKVSSVFDMAGQWRAS